MTDPYEAAAKAWFKDYDEVSDEYVEMVWSYESMEHPQPCYDPCAVCSFESIVEMAREGSRATVDAFLAASPDLYRKSKRPLTEAEARSFGFLVDCNQLVRVGEEPFDAADVVWDTVNVEHVTEIRFYETVGEEPE